MLPGASINLAGIYTLDGQQFEFTGKVRTQARLSQMVASRWKSWPLKLVDPFFHKNGAGAEIPVKVSGTKSEPHIGLNFGGCEHSKSRTSFELINARKSRGSGEGVAPHTGGNAVTSG